MNNNSKNSLSEGEEKKNGKQEEQIIAKALIAGSVCAVVAGSLNPFDVAKIRMQLHTAYFGLPATLKKIVREEGFLGLTKGLEPSMLREISYSSIRFGGYEPLRRVLSTNNEDPRSTTPIVKFSAALLSGGIGSALANPFDLVKTRFQAELPGEKLTYRNTFQAVRQIGLKGLYRGWIITCSRATVLNSAQIGSYDSIKHNLLMEVFGFKEGFLLHLCSSLAAGVITTTAANPFDVIKTRYLSDDRGRYRSISDCVRQTFRQGGIPVFFTGWTPAYLRLGPHTVLSFLLIEEIRSLLGMKTI
jgi:solute carrier family 25 protein 14/30